jgi:hypothetical protein
MTKNTSTQGSCLKVGSIDGNILGMIEAAIADIIFGSITLIVQDAHLIQMEKIEKIRFGETKTAAALRGAMPEKMRTGITEALQGLCYGQVLLTIKDGKIVQLERTEKQRFSMLQGVNGEGI